MCLLYHEEQTEKIREGYRGREKELITVYKNIKRKTLFGVYNKYVTPYKYVKVKEGWFRADKEPKIILSRPYKNSADKWDEQEMIENGIHVWSHKGVADVHLEWRSIVVTCTAMIEDLVGVDYLDT